MAMEKMAQGKDIGRGWAWIVLIASYGTIMTLCMSMYMSGVLYVAFLDRFQEEPAKTSIIGALNTGLHAVIAPFASLLVNAYSCRTIMVLGGFLCSLSYFLGYFLNSIDLFILVLGILVGFGIGMSFVPAVVVLAYNFKENRRLVVSMASVMPGVGMFAASPLCQFLLEMYGLQGTLLIISAINLQICVFGVICRPSSIELAVQREIKETKLNSNRKKRPPSLFSSLNERLLLLRKTLNFDLLFDISFLFFLLSTLAWGFMYNVCLVHLPNYLVKRKTPKADINGIMSTFSICTIAGRILISLTVEKGGLDSLTLHIGMCGLIGIVSVLFPFYGDLAGATYVYSGIMGTYLGGLNTVLCPITLSIVGVEKFSTGHGMAFLFGGVGQITGPYIAGILFSVTKSYDYAFIVGGAVTLFGSIFGMLSSLKSQTRFESQTISIENTERGVDGYNTTNNYRTSFDGKPSAQNDTEECDNVEKNKLLQVA